ncbi:hypothetical protein GCM10010507_60250 [Streptomyces cinnamoneus]|uniref:Uncharacterized protein n=1 Tax=Streptomyces cinnamoneus TaxID=53446 RepID=A0A918TZ70_STRCJ|nr:hypothetical protein GCM10010507_60250 [Streptomyces cinnamoneus]
MLPLAFLLTAGQATDSPQFVPVLGRIRVRASVGRPTRSPTCRPRARDGKIETIVPQRLPAVSPLAALTVGKHSGWVRTGDGTAFLAPR